MPKELRDRKDVMHRIRTVLYSDQATRIKVQIIAKIPEIIRSETITLAEHLKSIGEPIPPEEDGIPSAYDLIHTQTVPHPDAEVLALDLLSEFLKPEHPKLLRLASLKAISSSSLLIVLCMSLLLSYRDDEQIGYKVRGVLREFGAGRKLGGAYYLAAQRVADTAIWFDEP